MESIQISIDTQLLLQLDEVIHELGTDRSTFICCAIQQEIKRLMTHKREAQHIAGYKLQPQTSEEIEEWQAIQTWGDE